MDLNLSQKLIKIQACFLWPENRYVTSPGPWRGESCIYWSGLVTKTVGQISTISTASGKKDVTDQFWCTEMFLQSTFVYWYERDFLVIKFNQSYSWKSVCCIQTFLPDSSSAPQTFAAQRVGPCLDFLGYLGCLNAPRSRRKGCLQPRYPLCKRSPLLQRAIQGRKFYSVACQCLPFQEV